MKYLSGQVEIDGKKIKLTAFKNDYKKVEKHPDYILYIDRKKVGALWWSEAPSKAKKEEPPEETTNLEPF